MTKRRSKAKKSSNPYDENGRWVQEGNQVKGAIRKVFRLSPQMSDVLTNARVELPPLPKKDGTAGKRVRVRYKCSVCGELFQQKYVQVDHIDPVVPLHLRQKDMSYDDLVRGIFCPVDNLQVICSTPLKYNDNQPSCHKKKTDMENYIRDNVAPRDLKEDEIEGEIEKYRSKFEEVFKEKERKRLEKAERKRLRELKDKKRLKELQG